MTTETTTSNEPTSVEGKALQQALKQAHYVQTAKKVGVATLQIAAQIGFGMLGAGILMKVRDRKAANQNQDGNRAAA